MSQSLFILNALTIEGMENWKIDSESSMVENSESWKAGLKF